MSSTSRRGFLKATAAVAAATVANAGRLAAKPVGAPIGLQLYSVHDLLPKDFDGTLAKVRAAGYTQVETAGYHGRTAAEFLKAMQKSGLHCISALHPLKEFEEHGEALIEYGRALGIETLLCMAPGRRDPSLKGPMTLDDWRWTADKFNRIGAKVKDAGMSFAYHNDIQEFGVEGGVVFYDELLRLTDPKLVCFELDCGWAFAGGANPATILRKSPERFPLLHVKDMVKGENGEYHSTVMGRGVIDYRPILRAATNLKLRILEQEVFQMDVMESLRLDAEYVRELSF
jgi:sugar phosphate isomerase/epimerase